VLFTTTLVSILFEKDEYDCDRSLMQSLYGIANQPAHRFHDIQSVLSSIDVIVDLIGIIILK
jgi:hypothetical protein